MGTPEAIERSSYPERPSERIQSAPVNESRDAKCDTGYSRFYKNKRLLQINHLTYAVPMSDMSNGSFYVQYTLVETGKWWHTKADPVSGFWRSTRTQYHQSRMFALNLGIQMPLSQAASHRTPARTVLDSNN